MTSGSDASVGVASPDPGPLRRNRDFLTLWAGQACSEAGTSMSTLVFPLLGYAISHSTVAAGAVTSAVVVGQVLARFVSGVLVDHWPRRQVLVLANLVAAAAFGAAAAAAFGGVLRIGYLLGLAVVAGTADAFIGPASAAAVRLVVPRAQLSVALARMQARDHVAHLVGPPLGGALFAVAHGLPLAVDAVTYAVFALASAGLSSSLRASGDAAPEGVLAEARTGFGFMWRHPVIRAILTWGGLFNFATGYVFVALTLRLLRAGVHPASIGGVEAAAAVAGLAGAFAAPYVVRRTRSGSLTILTAFVVAVVMAPMAFTTNVVAVGVLLAAGNFLMPANNASIGGYLSAVTPDAMQARVFAAGGILALGFATAAPTVAGAALAPLGGTATLLIGAALVALSVAPLLANRDVRRLGTPAEWSAELT